jgi:hypothetical protein
MTPKEKAQRYDELEALLEYELERLETKLAASPEYIKKNFKEFSAYLGGVQVFLRPLKPLMTAPLP